MVLSVWISIISFISYLDLAHLANVIVDISEQNITSVPQNLLPNVTQLNLENNLINILDATSFDIYRGLVWLSVARNPLRRIKDGTFDKCRRLQTLLLSKTKITYLPIPFGPSVGKLGKLDLQNAIQDPSILRGEYLSGFANLKYLQLGMNSLNGMDDIVIPLSLESLHVAGNDITKFPDFTHLNMLKDLSIDTNHFTVIPTNLFNGLSSLARLSMVSCNLSTFPDPTNLLSLRRMDLRNNNLFTVPDFLDTGVTDLRIARNPILCDYRMCWRRMWTWIKPLPSGFDDVTCQHPPGMRGQAIMDVSVVDMECYKDSRFAPYFRQLHIWETSSFAPSYDLKVNTDSKLNDAVTSRSAVECGVACRRTRVCSGFVYEDEAGHTNGTCMFLMEPRVPPQIAAPASKKPNGPIIR